MFTGIIETRGSLVARRPRGDGAELTFETPKPLPNVRLGESIAVNGACLTVTTHRGRRFTVEVSPETLRRTTLGGLAVGAGVNLERALRLGDRIGGHIVQGHVDATGRLEGIRPDGNWFLYRFSTPRTFGPYLIEKGSIAVDGVSLTVFRCRPGTFTVALIPHTLKATTLGQLEPGTRVNLEADVLLKHIASLVAARQAKER